MALRLSSTLASRLSRSTVSSSILRTRLPFHSRSYVTSTSENPSEAISRLKKVSIVLEKAHTLADKLKQSAAYLNEDSLRNKSKAIDPLYIIDRDLDTLNKNIRSIIATQHPVLAAIAQYYFDLKGKRIRPVVILLLSRALWHHFYDNKPDAPKPEVSQYQSKLAEILEMIHTASLIHDDVIDVADTRRNTPSVNIAFGNKVSILAGDFLLARASISLAQMRSFEVTELMSRVISDLVEGEFMQMKAVKRSALDFEYYLQKTYYKTASLIANGCRACAILGISIFTDGTGNSITENTGTESNSTSLSTTTSLNSIVDNITEFGRNFGLAFQLVDDLLDYVSSAQQLGKPSGADLKLGLATAPCLYAAEEFPELKVLIERNFSDEGDPQKAYDLVHRSSGIEKTKMLAQQYIQKAIFALSSLKDSPAKQALIDITETVLTRTK